MYCFFYLLPFNILLTASAKERKKEPRQYPAPSLHRAITRLSVSCLPLPRRGGCSCVVFSRTMESWRHRFFQNCGILPNWSYDFLGFQTQLRVWSSSFFGFSVIIASAMERIGVFLVCVMFLGAVSTASVKYSIWNLVLTCRILANLVDLLSTSFQEKLRSELVKACLKWTL